MMGVEHPHRVAVAVKHYVCIGRRLQGEPGYGPVRKVPAEVVLEYAKTDDIHRFEVSAAAIGKLTHLRPGGFFTALHAYCCEDIDREGRQGRTSVVDEFFADLELPPWPGMIKPVEMREAWFKEVSGFVFDRWDKR
jgi:hypothetical protein